MELLPMEVDYNIALNLLYVDIVRYCQVNNNFIKICQDDFFWKHKFMKDFNITHVECHVDSWKFLYLDTITLTSLHTIDKCLCHIFDVSKLSNTYRKYMVKYIFRIILDTFIDSVYEYEHTILVNPCKYIRLHTNFLEDLAWIICTFNAEIVSNYEDPIKSIAHIIVHMFNQLYIIN